MSGRIATTRHRFRRWLGIERQRGVRIVAGAALVSLVGVTVTGIWQFFAHESNSAWFDYVPGSGARGARATPTSMAEWHAIFGAALGVVAMVGGGWLAYKVLYAVPWQMVVVFLTALFGLISGSIIRYNIVKLEGRDVREADRGYAQLFSDDLEYIVTSRNEFGALAAQLWTLAHLLTVPTVIVMIWLALPHGDDPDEARSTEREPPAAPDGSTVRR